MLYGGHLRIFARIACPSLALTQAEDPAAPYILSRFDCARHGSPESYAEIKRLYKNCREHHKDKCKSPENQELPTRLLDLGPPELALEPRLIITREDKEEEIREYVCLSYVWGEPPQEDSPENAEIKEDLSALFETNLQRKSFY